METTRTEPPCGPREAEQPETQAGWVKICKKHRTQCTNYHRPDFPKLSNTPAEKQTLVIGIFLGKQTASIPLKKTSRSRSLTHLQTWTEYLAYWAMPGGPMHLFGPLQVCYRLTRTILYSDLAQYLFSQITLADDPMKSFSSPLPTHLYYSSFKQLFPSYCVTVWKRERAEKEKN